MLTTENELQALKEERRRSAAKVRSLLEQLEQAEKEFNSITNRLQSVLQPEGSTTLHNASRQMR